ncbi:MAG TPA: PBP1A family penicillin-binding protein [Actinomycetota bacterium]|nr:PBP1A family penicillin-binding protein [Actinomycetota bacterium]
MRGRLAMSLLAAFALFASACSLSPIDLEERRPLALRSTIRAADGSLLARLFIENRALVSIDQIPFHLQRAVLAAEDARFYKHPGYDLRAIARAAVANISEGETVQGGSTITQQLVKNVYLADPERTFKRKALELRLAVELERQFSKREILEQYLNTVYFGEGAYGVRAAAETYFHKRIDELTLAESALLAALIKAPAAYDPRSHPDDAQVRRNYVLGRMLLLGFEERARIRAAQRSPLGIVRNPPKIRTRQPYFVEAVKRELMGDRRIGATAVERAATLWKGGIEVETTLVPWLQQAAEAAVRGVLNGPGDPEAALIALRPKTGEIVAMVAGRDWDVSQVNLALGREGGGSGRQPGSAFKPIALAAALEEGISLRAMYESSPAFFTFEDGSTWPVNNAEGGGGGFLPLDEALVHSVNGVYARLAMQIGGGPIATQAHLMGVKARLPAYPSIVLGAMEVSVLDMAAAYATLANGGTAVEPTTISRVTLAHGQVLRPQQDRIERAVSPGNAYLITKVMEQVIERGTGRAADIGRPAAGKTGTTNDYGDAWFVGFTPHLVTAVWVGYPQGRIPMTSVHGIRVFGGTFPAQIWRAFMTVALRNVPPKVFKLPASEFVTVRIDPKTGLLAAPWCPGPKRRILKVHAPTAYCPPPAPPTPTYTFFTPTPYERKGKETKEPTPGGRPSPQQEPTPTQAPSEDPTPAPSST